MSVGRRQQKRLKQKKPAGCGYRAERKELLQFRKRGFSAFFSHLIELDNGDFFKLDDIEAYCNAIDKDTLYSL